MAQPSFNLREQDLKQDATELPRRFPLVVGPQNRSDSTAKDAKLVNCYVEKDAKTGEYMLYGRPGLSVNATYTVSAAAGRGVFNWKGDIYSITGSTMYKNGASFQTGLNTAGGNYKFDGFLVPSRLLFKNTAVLYSTDGTTVTTVSDPDYPATTVPGLGFLDATEYVGVATDSTIHGSDLNAPTSWDPLNVLTAQIEADRLVAIDKQLVQIIALKEWSTEVFYDSGQTTGSPLGRVQGAKVNWGCISAATVQEVNGALMWVATYRKGNQSTAIGKVVMMDGLKAKVISWPPIERILETADYSDVRSFVLALNGHTFYFLTFPTTNITLVYDSEEDWWWQATDTDGNYWPFVSATSTSTQGHLLQHISNGKIYNCLPSYVNDDGSLFSCDIVTPNFDGGVKWNKYLPHLEFIADQTPGSILQVRSNDWDYDPKRWTNWRKVDLGKKRPYLDDCGTFVRRAYHLRHRCNARFRMFAMEMRLLLGTR